jgi:hypothetical protein
MDPCTSEDDISDTTFGIDIPVDYSRMLKACVTPLGPNARPPKNTFGATAKLDNLSPDDRKIDYYSMTKNVEQWTKYNDVGQTIPRKKLAQTYGKLVEAPGPADYTPNPTLLSTEEAAPKFSLHSRTTVNIVDKLETPGPGSYRIPSCIEPPPPMPKKKTRILSNISGGTMKGVTI